MTECLDPRDNAERCGICAVDLAMQAAYLARQAADPRYGSPSDMDAPP